MTINNRYYHPQLQPTVATRPRPDSVQIIFYLALHPNKRWGRGGGSEMLCGKIGCPEELSLSGIASNTSEPSKLQGRM